jgi:hypothetical protein
VGTEEAVINVPFLLFIPLIAVKILDLYNKSKMPHECYSLIRAYISSPKTSLDEEHWGLVLDWLLRLVAHSESGQGQEEPKCPGNGARCSGMQRFWRARMDGGPC